MKIGHRKKIIVLLLILALLCVGAVELLVCRYCDPTLYHTITDPVVTAITHTVTSVADTATAWQERLTAALHETELPEATPPLEDTAPAPTEEESDQTATAPLLISSAAQDSSVTQLKTVNGRDRLTGGLVEVVYFNQGDETWSELPYGTDKIGTHGCGPTAMAMVVDSLTDAAETPYTMAQLAVSRGHWARRSGSYHSIVKGLAADFGLTAESFSSREVTQLQDALLSGKLLVALMGPGHFTQSGHFIVLRGITLSGDILVADPNSLDNSLIAWDAQLLFDELSKSTAGGGPLWSISAPHPPLSE